MSQLDLQLTAGNNKDNRRALDFYPTPPEATIALMDFLNLDKSTIWECACGNNAMVDVLIDYGHDVIATDISNGLDYLTTYRDCDAIITNPPFNMSAEFIRKATSECGIVAFLLKSQYWHAKKRMSLFTELPPSYVLPLTWRPDFLYQERKDGKKGSPTMEVAWSIWINGKTDTRYIPLAKPSNTKTQCPK
jgi:hypothetical protein